LGCREASSFELKTREKITVNYYNCSLNEALRNERLGYEDYVKEQEAWLFFRNRWNQQAGNKPRDWLDRRCSTANSKASFDTRLCR